MKSAHRAQRERKGRLGVRILDYDIGVDGRAALKAVVWVGTLVAITCAQAADFELIGHVQPEQPLPVYLQGATTPFSATTEADLTYVLMVGGFQRTVEVGPSLADSKGRLRVTFDLRDAGAEPGLEHRPAFRSANCQSLKRRGVSMKTPKKRSGGETCLPLSRT
jgi:hypothetical protein